MYYYLKARKEEKEGILLQAGRKSTSISGTKLPTWNMKNSYSMEWTQRKGGGRLLRERGNGSCHKEELGLLYHEEGGGGTCHRGGGGMVMMIGSSICICLLLLGTK
jgi:hypothetical protein